MKELEIETPSGTAIYVQIEDDNGNLTTMPKAVWDELQAQELQRPQL